MEQSDFVARLVGPSDDFLKHKVLTAKIEAADTGINFVILDVSDGKIVSITAYSLWRAQEILEKYLARTSRLAESAIAKFENGLETESAKRAAK